jgi:tetratricopeptide (TPR) repeat protein
MHASHVLALSVLVSAGAAAGVSIALRPEPPPPPAPSASVQDLEKLGAELRAALQGLRAELLRQTAPAAAGPARTEVPTVSDAMVDAAVQRWFESRGGARAAEAAAAAPFDLQATVADMRSKHAWEDSAAWRRIQDAGQMDAVLAEFEKLAKANPNDVQAQMELANAYLGALQFDQSKWPLSIKADEVFDRVLELDPAHWQARFTKAVSYTFWPDFLGKKGEAITHFERLIEQQKTMPVAPGHAETYLFLGNLLDQRGERERAMAIWNQGLQRHPDSPELRQRLGR